MTLGVAGLVTINDPKSKVGDFVWDCITFTIAWIIGFAVGDKYREVDEERAALAEREREERALRAVADERARIARELHDVVGNSISVMTVQASARIATAATAAPRTAAECITDMRFRTEPGGNVGV